MSAKQSDEKYSEQEAAKRRDETLRRMINTPPTPHKKPPEKPTPAKKRKPKAPEK
jgi:hypothetical protein